MAPPPSTSADPAARERAVVAGMLELYAQERRIYGQVLELSRRQGDLIGRGGSFSEVRALLERKRDLLDEIAGLEIAEARGRAEWERNREGWRGEAAARLHRALHEVGQLIEEILVREEENDRLLLQRTGIS